MRSRMLWVSVLLLVPLAFLVGRFAPSRTSDGAAGEGGRRVLYYVDPMNPSFRAEAPGVAPCGMALEPVYADDSDGGSAALPPGAVAVRPGRQQFIGVTVETANAQPMEHSLRLLGTVKVDETRLYRVGSLTGGWVREVSSATSGTLVKKGEVLGRYFAQEAYNPQQAYIYALQAMDRQKKSGAPLPEQGLPFERTVRNTELALVNAGITREQIEHIARTREIEPLVEIRSPAAGFILSRNVALGQTFQENAELYTIADLRRVWVLADAFEGDAQFFQPGRRATVRLAGLDRVFRAVVSDVLPDFDDATRTLKVRLEVDNPSFELRPGMFVDVELPVTLGSAIAVPKEAVLDSGTRRSVFVEAEPGVFVPRRVETGWRYGGRVQILSGLMEGDRVVTSGNFLLDSESRMRAASARLTGPAAVDPVCGMDVEVARSKAAGLTATDGGETYFFCTSKCKEEFDRNPAAHASGRANPARRAAAPSTRARGTASMPAGHSMDAMLPGHAMDAMPVGKPMEALPAGHSMDAMPAGQAMAPTPAGRVRRRPVQMPTIPAVGEPELDDIEPGEPDPDDPAAAPEDAGAAR